MFDRALNMPLQNFFFFFENPKQKQKEPKYKNTKSIKLAKIV